MSPEVHSSSSKFSTWLQELTFYSIHSDCGKGKAAAAAAAVAAGGVCSHMAM